MSGGREYTNKEMDLIRTMYPIYGSKRIAEIIQRSRKAIMKKAWKEGIKCNAISDNRSEFFLNSIPRNEKRHDRTNIEIARIDEAT